MRFKYSVQGAERKHLVKAVGEILGEKPKYQGAPGFGYAVGGFEIDREGTLRAGPEIGRGRIERLIGQLAMKGYAGERVGDGGESGSEIGSECDGTLVSETVEAAPELVPEAAPEPEAPESAPAQAETGEAPGLTVTVGGSWTEEQLENLRRLIDSKARLIWKATGADRLTFIPTDEGLAFPWFDREPDAAEIKAYAHLIVALCEMAKRQKRVLAVEKDVPNDKYAFRCFLLRLGFIGKASGDERRVLLRNLDGNGSFRSGGRKPKPEVAAELPNPEGSCSSLNAAAEEAPTSAGGEKFEPPGNADDAIAYILHVLGA